MRLLRYISVMVFLTAVFAAPALAHKVNLFAYVEDGKVYTESYFPDGRPVEGGKVAVYDSGNTLLLEGVTDKQGYFNFAIPKIDDLVIVLNATMGHKTRFTLKKSDVEAGK